MLPLTLLCNENWILNSNLHWNFNSILYWNLKCVSVILTQIMLHKRGFLELLCDHFRILDATLLINHLYRVNEIFHWQSWHKVLG